MRISITINLSRTDVVVLLEALYAYFKSSSDSNKLISSNRLIRQFKAMYKLIDEG